MLSISNQALVEAAAGSAHNGNCVWRVIRSAVVMGVALAVLPSHAELMCGISGKSITLGQGCAGGGRYQVSMTNIGKDATLAPNTVGGLATYGLALTYTSCILADGSLVNGSITGTVNEYNGIQNAGSCLSLPRRATDPLAKGYYGGNLTASLTINGHPIAADAVFSLQDGMPTVVIQVNGRHYVAKGEDTYDATVARVLRAAEKVPEDGLWAITAEIDGHPGRGFQLEVRNGVLVTTVYGYDSAGNPTFYLASGPLTNGSSSQSLEYFHGGTTFGGPVHSATQAGSAGTATFAFTDSTHGTVTFPGESAQAIKKLDWADPVDQTGNQPLAGLWAVDSEINGEPGRGFQVETQNGVMVVTVYGYDALGNGTFYLGSGAFATGSIATSLTTYRGGRTFGGAARSAVDAGSVGQVQIHFTSDSLGQITFPGELPKTIRKFTW